MIINPSIKIQAYPVENKFSPNYGECKCNGITLKLQPVFSADYKTGTLRTKVSGCSLRHPVVKLMYCAKLFLSPLKQSGIRSQICKLTVSVICTFQESRAVFNFCTRSWSSTEKWNVHISHYRCHHDVRYCLEKKNDVRVWELGDSQVCKSNISNLNTEIKCSVTRPIW